MHFHIRPACSADQRTIRRLVWQAKLGPFGLHWPKFLVAEQGGEIIGVGQVKTHRDGSRELASLAVIPTNQGQGVGTALVQALLDRETGVVFLYCQAGLRRYYQRFGFEVTAPDRLSRDIRRLLQLIHLGTGLLTRLTGRRLKVIAMRREPSPKA